MHRSSLIFLPALFFPVSLLAAPNAVKVEVLQNRLDHPRSMAFLPDNKGLLVTLKGASLSTGRPGRGYPIPSSVCQRYGRTAVGGLLDVVLAPDFDTSRRVWLSYAEAGQDGKAGTAVGYGRLSDDLSRIEAFGGLPPDAETLHR